MQPVYHAVSSKGGRDSNEDRCWSKVTDSAACFAVADGLGGHTGGAQAAELAIQAIAERFESQPEASPEILKAMLNDADARIAQAQQQDPQLSRMRSTAVVLVTDYFHVHWAHIGDSRLYRFENGGLASYTLDHSVPQELAAIGDIPRNAIQRHPDRNRLLRSLGSGVSARPELNATPVEWQPGDAFLLCTDGLWEHLEDEALELDLAKSVDAIDWLDRLLHRVRLTAAHGHDNYTAIAVQAGIWR